MLDQDSIAKLRRFMELREERDVAKKAMEKAESEYKDAESDLHQTLAASTVKGALKVDLGEPWGTVSFLPRETVYGRISDKNKALEYFKSRGRDGEIYEPKPTMARINEIVRDAREQGEELPPGVDFFTRAGVTVTRQKS